MPSQSSARKVEIVMASDHPNGQPWKIPAKGSLVDVKRALNSGSGDTFVTIDVDGADSIVLNPAYVMAIQFRRPSEEPW